MKRITVDGLPGDPLAAAGVFHQHWLAHVEQILRTGEDVLLALPAADHTHREWRLAIAAGLAESRGAEGLIIAAHSGDHAIYPDCREEFMAAMGDAITLGTYEKIDLIRPFISLRKEEIAVRGSELGVDFAQTWSCYKGGEIHCGTCGTCVERREAFQVAGLPDPTEYLETGELPASPAGD